MYTVQKTDSLGIQTSTGCLDFRGLHSFGDTRQVGHIPSTYDSDQRLVSSQLYTVYRHGDLVGSQKGEIGERATWFG